MGKTSLGGAKPITSRRTTIELRAPTYNELRRTYSNITILQGPASPVPLPRGRRERIPTQRPLHRLSRQAGHQSFRDKAFVSSSDSFPVCVFRHQSYSVGYRYPFPDNKKCTVLAYAYSTLSLAASDVDLEPDPQIRITDPDPDSYYKFNEKVQYDLLVPIIF